MSAPIAIPRPGAGLLGLARRVVPLPPPPPPRPGPVPAPRPPPPPEPPPAAAAPPPAASAERPRSDLAPTSLRPRSRPWIPRKATAEEERSLLALAAERDRVLLAVWLLARREGAPGPHALEEVVSLLERRERPMGLERVSARASSLVAAGFLERADLGPRMVRITAAGLRRVRDRPSVEALVAAARSSSSALARALERVADTPSRRAKVRAAREALERAIADLEALA